MLIFFVMLVYGFSKYLPDERHRAYERGLNEGTRIGREARWNELYVEREKEARVAQREAQIKTAEIQGVRRARISDAIIKPKQIRR
jgi:hypothetical protein